MVLSARGCSCAIAAKDVNDGACASCCGWRTPTAIARATGQDCRGGPAPAPIPTCLGAERAATRGGPRAAAPRRARLAQRLVLGRDRGDGGGAHRRRADRSPRRFFSAKARSIVLGCTSSRAAAGATSPARAPGSVRPADVLLEKCQDLAVELVRAAGPRFLGTSPAIPAARSSPWPGSRSAGRRRTPSEASVTDALSTKTRRSISYLTCTASRGSKNSPCRNFGSRTFSGAAFNVPSSRRAAAFALGLAGAMISGLCPPVVVREDNYTADWPSVKLSQQDSQPVHVGMSRRWSPSARQVCGGI